MTLRNNPECTGSSTSALGVGAGHGAGHRARHGGKLMLLRSIRSQLLGLVLATVVPFTALIGGGLWSQWRSDRAAAIERALAEARVLAAQVDDHIGNLEKLMGGLARAVSTDAADTVANDVLLRRVRSELPDFISNILLASRDGTNIG